MKDLTAIERIDRNHIEDEYSRIDDGKGEEEVHNVGILELQAGDACEYKRPDGDREQDHVHQRTGGDAPQ
jgi:hypothetical protein